MPTEADTCRKHVVPLLQSAGWEAEPHSIAEQRSITDGRIVPVGKGFIRRPPKRVDYLLRFRRDFPIAIVEAKAEYKAALDGLQQAKEYAEMLGLKFAYATNGPDIIEFDYFTGLEIHRADYPTPDDLWQRYQQGSGFVDETFNRLLEPSNYSVGKGERYYQQIAIHRTVEAVLKGQRRLLLTMATGTGKTVVAFQICWKLWNARWNRTGEHRRPKILYLADRNILVDQPKDGIFSAFGDARCKIESGEVVKSREMYFAIYQALAEDQHRDGLFKQFPVDFFDLVIVDECHRGSARDESSWRAILDYFEPAYKLGMTATPLREDNRDTYNYFGDPLYTYSLRQGIEDGFLAPYRVHRVITEAYFQIPRIWQEIAMGSKGVGSRRIRVQPDKVLAHQIPLPPLAEQQAIAARLNALAEKNRQVDVHLLAVERDATHLLALRFRDAIDGAPLLPMAKVAPFVRRPVDIDISKRYHEVGARSFGKGLFIKPDFDGAEATWQKPIWIKKGDLVLSNIKAWEGAISVACDEHNGCIASHRYITCMPDPNLATASFLAYYLLSEDGLEKVGFASPGTADRNRTLSLGNLHKIEVPVPPLAVQNTFDRLQAEIAKLKAQHTSIRQANAALLPATLERLFSKE